MDPTGEFADYYDKDGTWLFNDGVNDDLAYVRTKVVNGTETVTDANGAVTTITTGGTD